MTEHASQGVGRPQQRFALRSAEAPLERVGDDPVRSAGEQGAAIPLLLMVLPGLDDEFADTTLGQLTRQRTQAALVCRTLTPRKRDGRVRLEREEIDLDRPSRAR